MFYTFLHFLLQLRESSCFNLYVCFRFFCLTIVPWAPYVVQVVKIKILPRLPATQKLRRIELKKLLNTKPRCHKWLLHSSLFLFTSENFKAYTDTLPNIFPFLCTLPNQLNFCTKEKIVSSHADLSILQRKKIRQLSGWVEDSFRLSAPLGSLQFFLNHRVFYPTPCTHLSNTDIRA